MIEWQVFALFAAFVGLAGYVQTVTGFAFGLLVMGLVGMTGLIGIAEGAVAVSVLSLVNVATALLGHERHIDRRAFAAIAALGLPAVMVGFFVTDYLSAENTDALKLVLGAAILVSCIFLILRPAPQDSRSRGGTFAGFGLLGGLMGGLFSTSGPPLVYVLYRQPIDVRAVRDTLLVSFATFSSLRLSLVLGTGGAQPGTWLLCAVGVPAVFVGTKLARRLPPPWSAMTLRRMAFVLLMMSGLALAGPVVAAHFS